MQTATKPPIGAGFRQDRVGFHTRHDGKNYIFRLYFVDTPENETRFPARVAEQAAHFGCSSERAMEIGKEASDFTTRALGPKPFTVYTLRRDALGASSQPRFYAVVETDKGNLAELLVKNGLARIYGKRVQLPDGTDSRAYLEKLAALKEKAMAAYKGGWAELAVAK